MWILSLLVWSAGFWFVVFGGMAGAMLLIADPAAGIILLLIVAAIARRL
jgi:hypothetical protein